MLPIPFCVRFAVLSEAMYRRTGMGPDDLQEWRDTCLQQNHGIPRFAGFFTCWKREQAVFCPVWDAGMTILS